uniref:Zinc transporter 8 n=1 Tax=Lygus hesperus TaxID=30085 RepID=A0A0A9VZB7_LYGHE
MRVSLLCFIFMCVELVGGYIAKSLSIMTDAAHLLSDLASFIISIVAIFISRKAPTASYSFGFYRAEILGALISVMLIWVLTVALVTEAIERIRNPVPIDGKIMFIISLLGIFVNVVMGLVLLHSGHGHVHGGLPHSDGGHSHSNGGHSHSNGGHSNGDTTASNTLDYIYNTTNTTPNLLPSTDTVPLTEYTKTMNNNLYAVVPNTNIISTHVNRTENSPLLDENSIQNGVPNTTNKDNHVVDTDMKHETESHHDNHSSFAFDDINTNVKAALVHIIGDALQSTGVFIAASLVWWNPTWVIVDPICTIVFSIIVIFTTTRIFKDGIMVLMEGVPSHINHNDILQELRSLPGVIRVHDLHVWSLSIGNPALSVHIIVDNVSKDNILRLSNAILSKRFNIHHSTIQIESPDDPITCNLNAPRQCYRNADEVKAK